MNQQEYRPDPSILAQAQQGTPIIDGERAIFVWQGETAPQLIGDWTGWEQGAPAVLAEVEPGLWAYSLALPVDAYLEYVYWQDGRRVPDPLNSRTTPNGMGGTNHWFYMPEGAPTPLTRRQRNVPVGTITRHQIENDFLIVGRKRDVYLYDPPVDEQVPLLIVLDGREYRRRAKLVHIVDNLIAQGRIRPIALAMVANHRQARGVEYACAETTAALLAYEVVALAQAKLNLVDVEARPGAYGVMGASMGGLMALYAALRMPQLFGHVLSQSGSFTLGGYDTVVWDLVRHIPVPPLKLWLDVGRYEGFLDCNRRMRDLLVARGHDVVYREYNAGHNYPAWRDDLWRGLELLFGA